MLEEQIISIYCVCDELVKAYQIQDDKQCKMSSAEIMTFAMFSTLHCEANYKKTRYFSKALKIFPRILSNSRLVRRIHQIPIPLWYAIFTFSKEILEVDKVSEFIVDSFPVPVCQKNKIFRSKLFPRKPFHGYTASKKSYFKGIKVHMIVSLNGMPIEFQISPGKDTDVKVFQNFDCDLPKGSTIFADKAYNDYLQEDLLKPQLPVNLPSLH